MEHVAFNTPAKTYHIIVPPEPILLMNKLGVVGIKSNTWPIPQRSVESQQPFTENSILDNLIE